MYTISNQVFDNDNLNQNRGLDFGDGLFETLIFYENQFRFLNIHFDRITKGMEVLGLEKTDFLSDFQTFSNFMDSSLTAEKREVVRVKLKVWRKGAGAYASEETKWDWMLSSNELKHQVLFNKENIGFSDFHSQSPALSNIKSLSCLNYVLAANQARVNHWGDAILMDQLGNVGELTSSNLFWVKEDTVFTPSLSTGCVAGVLREVLKREIPAYGYECREVLANKNTLLNADAVFASNVLGVFTISKVEETQFGEHPLVNELQNKLCIKLK